MKKVYQISLVGCDDETVFKMELTDEEYKLLKKLAIKLMRHLHIFACL